MRTTYAAIHRARAAIIAGSLFALYGCADEPTPLQPAGPPPQASVASAFGVLEDVPAVTMDLPPSPRPWDSDDAALVAALEAEDGHAIVAIKLPVSARAASATGRRAALPAAAFEQGLQFLQGRGAEILHVYRSFGAASVRIDPALGPAIRNNPLVDYVEPRQRWHLAGAPASATAVAAMLAGQTTPWGITMVRAPEAWTLTTGGGVKVLIIDTGVNPHVDLPSIPGANCGGQFGGCTDGPIYHGTHVSGTFFGQNNTTGVVGVAPGIAGNLVYGWGACSSSTGECFPEQIAAGIDAGKFAGVKVISMSLGGPFDQGIANAVASAWATGGIVLVAAAGNIRSIDQGGQLHYPAAYSNVIGVSGVRPDKTFASSSPCPHPAGGTVASNHGAHVDLAAPFWARSTVGTSNYEDENQGWCGTSMATPHVSGAAALVWAKNPGWSNQQVVNRLLSTAEDGGASGWDNLFGYGIVDAAEAVGVQPDPPPDPQFDVFISGTPDIAPQAWCEWSAHPSGGAPPYSYAWTVRYVGTFNDLPVGDGSNLLQYTNEGSSFLIKVTVTDQNNHTAYTEHPVNVAQGMYCT